LIRRTEGFQKWRVEEGGGGARGGTVVEPLSTWVFGGRWPLRLVGKEKLRRGPGGLTANISGACLEVGKGTFGFSSSKLKGL